MDLSFSLDTLMSKKEEEVRSVTKCSSLFPKLLTVFKRVRLPSKGLGFSGNSFSEKHYFNGLICQPGIMHRLTDFSDWCFQISEWCSNTPASSGQEGREDLGKQQLLWWRKSCPAHPSRNNPHICTALLKPFSNPSLGGLHRRFTSVRPNPPILQPVQARLGSLTLLV